MIAVLNKQIQNIKHILEPKLRLAQAKWLQLQPREQRLVSALGVFLLIFILFSIVSGMRALRVNLDRDVDNLHSLTLFSKQIAARYKKTSKIEANTFNQVSLEQIKGDVSQVLHVKAPDILIQDGQMTITVSNTEFTLVMTLLDQFRRSYAIFPSQLTITRQSRSGFVSFSATFWIKQ